MSLESTREFFEIAGRHGMLPLETLRDLQLEASHRELEGSTLALQKGLMTPLDIEIIETLRHPIDAVPGYEILSVLGRGGMGVVYKARQVALDRIVALKMVLIGHADNPAVLARFEQEAQTVARLIHPHIITAFDFGKHAGRLYFAMEYVEGEDAERYVKRLHPLDERQVWMLIRQAASGLAHAAESGIVHRDIKPANMLLVTPPKGFPLPPGVPMVKIADFGLAFLSAEVNDRTRLTSEQSTLGSPHYMAPEQLNAGGVVDFRADLYSLGASAFHLLAGRAPFDGLSLPQIIAKKLGADVPRLDDVRPGLSHPTVELVEMLLITKPEQRIGSYTELLDRIDMLPVMSLAGSSPTIPIPLGAESTIEIDRPAGSIHHPWKDAVLTVIAILVLIAFGFGLRQFFASKPSGVTVTASSLKPTGWTSHLLDGVSLDGWRADSGTWALEADDEGGAVIAGTSGEIIRGIAKVIEGKPARIAYYRLTITARLHEATAIELHFNVDKAGGRDAARITLDRVSLGRRASSRSDFEPHGEARAFDVGAEQLHELRLERDLSDWRFYIDEKLIGTIGVSKLPERPEFHLVAEGGPAWFGDALVEELAEPKK
ncbi:MAG: protein kinase [Planctomycetaceae bacterium]